VSIVRAEKELAARISVLEERTAVVERRLDGLHTAVKHLARALDGHEDAESQALRVVASELGHELELAELQLTRRAVTS
jgi:uncharacterized coiled-coil protein SlyX